MKNLFLLFTGVFALYSSMTCYVVPVFNDNQGSKVIHIHNPSNIFKKTGIQSNDVYTFENDPSQQKNKGKKEKSNLFTNNEKDKIKWETKAQYPNMEVPMPKYTRGIYLSNNTGLSTKRMKFFIEKAKEYNINTFVIDAQKQTLSAKMIYNVKKNGIFPVARVVVFEGGLKSVHPPKWKINSILAHIKKAAQLGFAEVQLDYIRYADRPRFQRMSLKKKYAVINSILKKAKEQADKYKIYLSADVFGRITLNRNDHIGQKLENFAKYLHVIYPMVYPSHYTNDKRRIKHPYATVKEGMLKSKKRLKNTRVVAYIQGFGYKVKESGLSMVNYIKRQMLACSDSKSDGWIIWNPRNQYYTSFKAIEYYRKAQLEKLKKEKNKKVVKNDTNTKSSTL